MVMIKTSQCWEHSFFLIIIMIFLIVILILMRQVQWLLINETALSKSLSINERTFFKQTEKSTIPAFIEYAKHHNLQISDQQITKIGNNLLMLLKITVLKIFYLRPRPIASSNRSVYAFGPSYPSGHAYQARYIACELGKLFPKHIKALNKLAEKCANIRVKSGVHYPSDISWIK